jgi:hypothetical protein
MRLSLFILSLSLLTSSHAQFNLRDSLTNALQEKPKIFIGFHNRNTIIQARQTKLYGLVAGADFNKKLRLYMGLYGFSHSNEVRLQYSTRFSSDSIYRNLSTRYLSFGAEYTYYTYNRISLSAPIQLGFGNMQFDYSKGKQRIPLVTDKFKMMPLEIGSSAYLELLPWVGVKGGIGYRLQLGRKQVAQYSAPYYSLGISVLIGEIYKDIKETFNDK